NGYKMDRCIVTAQNGGIITYKLGKTINPGTTAVPSTANVGYGYFFQNDPRTLDQFGEWYFDTTAKKIQVFFGTATPSNYLVQVSTIDTLFDIGAKTNIRINNFVFEGANMS